MPLLFDLEQRNFAYGVTSPSIGSYSKRQMLLDMSSGTRIANGAYSHPLGRLDLEYGPGGGRMAGWFYDNKRAVNAPGDVLPGLFASTLERAGHRVGYAGVVGFEQTEARRGRGPRGRVERVSLGTVGTFAQRTLALLAPLGRGRGALPHGRARARGARQDRGRAPPGRPHLRHPRPAAGTRAPAADGHARARVQGEGPVLGHAPAAPASWRRPTWRPTVLHFLGVPVPKQIEGRVIEARPDGDAEAVREQHGAARRRARPAQPGAEGLRRCAALLLLAVGLWAARRRAGLRAAARIAFLAVLWLPGVALVTAATAPSKHGGAAGACARVDRRWPRSTTGSFRGRSRRSCRRRSSSARTRSTSRAAPR